jgi:arylsulfatase A-like enzyme
MERKIAETTVDIKLANSFCFQTKERYRIFALATLFCLPGLSAGNINGKTSEKSIEENMSTPKRPNIIFVLSDQQRWDTLGIYGQSLDVTPNLDRLGREGVCFESAFSCQPVCGPARSCLMTGRYPTETGCFKNGLGLRKNERTIARYLTKSGYDVAYVGKWHLGSSAEERVDGPVPLEGRGGFNGYWMGAEIPEFTSNGYSGWLFDRNMKKVKFNKYRVDAFTDFALEYLDQRPADKPFFLFLSYVEPHQQSYRKNRYRGPKTGKLEDMKNLLHGFTRYEGPKEERERFKKTKVPVPADLLKNRGDWDVAAADYIASCNRIDTNVGRLLKRLKELKILDNTLIIYSSDHGCHFHTRNNNDKCTAHANSSRIPLIINGPGFRNGRFVKKLVNLIDLPPTILAASKTPVPSEMYGRPLQDLAAGKAENWKNDVFIQTGPPVFTRAIRTPKWTYVVSAPPKNVTENGGSDKYIESFLYNLQDDPSEQKNLIADASLKQVKDDLRQRLVKCMIKAGEQEPEIELKNK